MAKDKKGFVLYADLLTVVEKLATQDRENKTNYAGELFLHILKYVNDKNPIPINFIIEMAFEPIKLQLKRDLEKYEQVKVKRSQAGKKSAELRALKKQQNSTKPTSVESVQQNSTNPTVIDIVNVIDTVTDINKDNNSADVKTSTPSIDFDKLLNFINKHTQREGRSKFKIINQSVKNSYKARLKEGYTNEDIGNAIKNAANDPFHKENNYRHLTPKFFSRSDKIDLHGFKTNATKSKISIKDFSSNPYNEQTNI